MRINISMPISVLDEVNINAEKPIGRVRLHIEDDWLVIKVLASTIKFRPHAENGNLVLQNIEVSGLLWPAQPKIVKSLEESAKKIVIPKLSMSIKDKKMQISFDTNLEIT